jgi:TetR/AcrR family transcriptional repressor of nem operon
VTTQISASSREKIIVAATSIAQAHGYSGLNVRALAEEVGIKVASLYHHFPSKADLAAAVAKRYWQDAATALEAMAAESADPSAWLLKFPSTFRASLENDNRLCLCSFMAAEYDDLPDVVKQEVQAFADVNVEWLTRAVTAAGLAGAKDAKKRAQSIFAAVAGAQLMARSRSDLKLFDTLIENYRATGLLPA